MDDQAAFTLSKLNKKMTELIENTRETNDNLEKLIKLLWEIKSNDKREDS